MHRRFENLRPRSAVLVVATATALVVLGSAAIAELLDGNEFGGFDEALWWSLQTVTTVGYGDVVPAGGRGRIIAGVVMLLGIAASAVLTAFVTSALFEAALRRHRGFDEHAIMERLDAIDARLSAIAERPPGDPG
jgi:voltage-gated potassium channel